MFMSLSTTKKCFPLVCPFIAASIVFFPSSSFFLLIFTITWNHELPPGLTLTSITSISAFFTSSNTVGSRGIPIIILCSNPPGNNACHIALGLA